MKSDVTVFHEEGDEVEVILTDDAVRIGVTDGSSALRCAALYLSKKNAIKLWKGIGKLKLIGEDDAKHK